MPKQVEKDGEREKIKITIPFRSSPSVTENCQKIAKKLKKLKKNTVMAPFHAKIGWKKWRQSENKNYRSILFPPDVPLWLHFKPKYVGKAREREKIKIIIQFWSCPTRNKKLQKIGKQIQKIKKYYYDFFSSQNRLEKAKKEKK